MIGVDYADQLPLLPLLPPLQHATRDFLPDATHGSNERLSNVPISFSIYEGSARYAIGSECEMWDAYGESLVTEASKQRDWEERQVVRTPRASTTDGAADSERSMGVIYNKVYPLPVFLLTYLLFIPPSHFTSPFPPSPGAMSLTIPVSWAPQESHEDLWIECSNFSGIVLSSAVNNIGTRGLRTNPSE